MRLSNKLHPLTQGYQQKNELTPFQFLLGTQQLEGLQTASTANQPFLGTEPKQALHNPWPCGSANHTLDSRPAARTAALRKQLQICEGRPYADHHYLSYHTNQRQNTRELLEDMVWQRVCPVHCLALSEETRRHREWLQETANRTCISERIGNLQPPGETVVSESIVASATGADQTPHDAKVGHADLGNMKPLGNHALPAYFSGGTVHGPPCNSAPFLETPPQIGKPPQLSPRLASHPILRESSKHPALDLESQSMEDEATPIRSFPC